VLFFAPPSLPLLMPPPHAPNPTGLSQRARGTNPLSQPRPHPPSSHHASPSPMPPQQPSTLPDRSRKQTYRIQLKKIDPRLPTDRPAIFQATFHDLNAPLIRLTDTATGFYAVTDVASAIDKLTSKKATDIFRKINLQPVIPPDLRSKRTIFVRQLDRDIGKKTPTEIKDEITRLQNWIQVQDVIKIKDYTHIIKIITTDTTIAQRILTEGFSMFNTRITPTQCEQEKYTHILICYKCYKFEDHPTHKCTNTTPSCSECASNDHTHIQCNSTYKKCLNCHQEHRTLAANCPYRKQSIMNKEKTTQDHETKKAQHTYAEIAKHAIQQTNIPQHSLTLTNTTQIKLTAIILEAHIASLARQEGFGSILSKSLKANYDIDATFPDRDSAKIFNFFYNHDENKAQSENDFNIGTEFIDDDDMRRSSLNLTEPRTDYEIPKIPKKDLLPPSTKTHYEDRDQRKRKVSDEQYTESPISISGHDEPISVRLFRSDKDLNPVPAAPNNIWYIDELRKKEYGLKLSVKDLDSSKIFDYLRRDKLKFNRPTINIIPHDIFSTMDKHSTITTKKTKQYTFKPPQ
jgi:hypothetical protein